MALLPKGGWVTAGADGVLISWTADGKLIHRFEGHKGVVSALAVSKDGKTIYSAGLDRTVREWDVETGKERRKCVVETSKTRFAYSLVLSPDGKRMAVGVSRGEVRILDVGELKFEKLLKPRVRLLSGFTRTAVFVSDESIVSCDSGRALRFWDVGDKGELQSIELPGGSRADSARLALSPDGKTVVVPMIRDGVKSSEEYETPISEIGIWEIKTGKPLEQFKTEAQSSVTALTYLPDGKALAVGDSDGIVWVIDLEKKKTRHTFKGHRGPVLSLAVSPDGKTLSSGGADTTVLVWNLAKP